MLGMAAFLAFAFKQWVAGIICVGFIIILARPGKRYKARMQKEDDTEQRRQDIIEEERLKETGRLQAHEDYALEKARKTRKRGLF